MGCIYILYKPVFRRIKQANKITQSGPELRRRPSIGTNVNPFTPIEVQKKSRLTLGFLSEKDRKSQGPLVSTPLLEKEISKPKKVSGLCKLICADISVNFLPIFFCIL